MKRYDTLDRILDSHDTTVGGGSASAIAGAICCSLIAMVARLSIARQDCGLGDEVYLEMAEEADVLSQRLLNGADRDREAYSRVAGAYRMQKTSPEEKEARKAAIQGALLCATQAPLENARMCARALEIYSALSPDSNRSARSDLEVGRLLGVAGLIGCALNVQANLSSLKDTAVREEMSSEMDSLLRSAEAYAGVPIGRSAK